MDAKERFVWLDACRLIAGVSMVGLHATADSRGLPWAAYTADERVIPMIFRAIIYTARTELFLVISIFLLMMALDRRPRGYSQTILEQSRRLLIPFGFWVIFYAFYTLIKANSFGYGQAWAASLLDPASWIGFFGLGDVKYHMHFIPTLFGMLLFFPLFRIAVRHPSTGLVILACLVIKREIDTALWAEFWNADWLPWALRGIKIFTYLGYGMVAGALYGIWTQTTRDQRATWVPLILFVAVMLCLLKGVATYQTIQTGAWPYGYTPGFWADFLMPVGLFALCMCLAHRTWPEILSRWAPYSFGLYLCHPIFLDLAEIWLRDTAWTPTAQIAFKIGIALPLTALLVVALSRCRPLAWTVGLGPLPQIFPTTSYTPQRES